MSDPSDAIKEFLREAESVYDEYDEGYIDAVGPSVRRALTR